MQTRSRREKEWVILKKQKPGKKGGDEGRRGGKEAGGCWLWGGAKDSQTSLGSFCVRREVCSGKSERGGGRHAKRGMRPVEINYLAGQEAVGKKSVTSETQRGKNDRFGAGPQPRVRGGTKRGRVGADYDRCETGQVILKTTRGKRSAATNEKILEGG